MNRFKDGFTAENAELAEESLKKKSQVVLRDLCGE